MAIRSLASLNQAYMSRFSGLQSGIDTDTIVQNLMRAQQIKYNKMYQSKIRDQWKKEAYTEINNALRKFKDEYASFLGSSNMMTSSVYKSYKVEMASNSYLSVAAGANSKEGNYAVEIHQLASGTTMTGDAASSDINGFTASQIAGTKIGSISTFASSQTVSGAIQFKINGKTFNFTANDTMKTVMDSVNGSDAGVIMSYTQLTNAFVLETKATGSQVGANQLDVDDISGFLGVIGLGAATVTGPTQAELTINGTAVTRDSNSFEIDGINYKLTQPTGSAISFSVGHDAKTGVDSIKKLVSAYNELMTTLYGSLTEKKNYGYAPLTEEQRGDLTEKEADLWDKMAKAGILGRDSALQRLSDSLRGAFSNAIGGMGALSSIGISGGAYRAGQPSLIQIDEAKLLAALEQDPDKVFRMFTERVEDANGGVITSQSGLMLRLTAAMDTFTTTTRDSVGSSISSLDNSIRAWDDKMKAELTRLYNMQESYYKKFTALETALAKLQSQTNALGLMGYRYE